MFSDILLTVDYDRTMTAPDGSVPARNLEAIHYFKERGGIITLNTGRSIPMAKRDILHQLPVNAPLLMYNGSAAYDEKTNQFTRYTPIDLDPDQVLPDVQEKFPELSVEVQGVYAHYLMHRQPGWEAFNDHHNCAWGYETPSKIPGPFLKFALYGNFTGTNMATMYEITPREEALMEEAVDYIVGRYGDKLEVFRACPRIIDFHAKGCSKLNSARLLQKELGRRLLVCVGDGENDLTMLSGADFAYSPSDGVVADRFENVCPCSEGSVADVIYHKIPKML